MLLNRVIRVIGDDMNIFDFRGMKKILEKIAGSTEMPMLVREEYEERMMTCCF